MSRLVALLLATLFALSLIACNQRAPLAPESQEPRVTVAAETGDTLAALFALTLDPVALTATAEPSRALAAQPPQGQIYDLDIDKFLNGDSFRIVGFGTDASGNFVVTFSHAHPFPAPDITLPPTGINRADLGYTGRVVLVVDENPLSFFSGEVQLDPTTVVNPDGYVNPGDLLAGIAPVDGFAYPYVLLADEAKDNRVGISNGDDMRGNHLPASKGWQRSNLGETGDGWTGFDYVHGGQTITNTITIAAAALAGGPKTFHTAILIKYTDPRGAGGKVNRLPSDPANVLEFTYRLPYSALDASVVSYAAGPSIGIDAAVETQLAFTLRDWDAKATEAADSTVGDETDVRLVQLGGSGAPAAQFHCPALKATPFAIPVIANSRTGFPGSELQFEATISNVLGTAPAGVTYGCLRLIDPEDGDATLPPYHFGVDPETILPDPARALAVRTYQVMPVTVNPPPPVVTAVVPTGTVGLQGAQVIFSATASNSPTSWSWDFGDGASPNTSTAAMPQVSLGTPGEYSGAVIASNASGPSASFPFTFTVLPVTGSPVISRVLPEGTVGTQGTQVTFGAVASNAPTAWSWSFGGGATPNTSSSATPEVTLGATGSYSGSVTATNVVGASEVFAFDYTVGSSAVPPVVTQVTPTGTVGMTGTQVSFSATASNSPTGWSWNFGGGASPNTSTSGAPLVTLGAPGTYNGTLSASNAVGWSSPFQFSFTVSALPNPPVIESVFPSGVAGGTGGTVTFRVTATNTPTSWSWNFGGGASPNTSTAKTPQVTLGAIGVYTGTVIAGNVSGNSAPFEFSYEVGISTAVPIILSVSPTGEVMCPRGGPMEFSIDATNDPTGWFWDFGGGANPPTSTDATPNVTLLEPGTYEASVTATNAVGSSNPFTFEYTVVPGWQSHTAPITNIAKMVLYVNKPIVMSVDRDAQNDAATLKFYAALQEVPQAASDWVTHDALTYTTTRDVRHAADLRVSNGHIFIFYVADSLTHVLVSNAAEPVLPSGPSSWTSHLLYDSGTAAFIDSAATTHLGKLAAVTGAPAAAVLTADVNVPSTTEDWTLLGSATGGNPLSILSYQPLGEAVPLLAVGANESVTVVGHPTHEIASSSGYIAVTPGADPRLLFVDGGGTQRLATVPIPVSASDWIPFEYSFGGDRIFEVLVNGSTVMGYGVSGSETSPVRVAFARGTDWTGDDNWEEEAVGPPPLQADWVSAVVLADGTIGLLQSESSFARFSQRLCDYVP